MLTYLHDKSKLELQILITALTAYVLNTLLGVCALVYTIMKIIVKNCHECPFCNNDNEYGKNACNLNLEIVLKAWVELPRDNIHEQCPLLKENYEIGTI